MRKRNLGQQILLLRRERGLSQLDLGVAIGRDNSFICRVEADEYVPSVESLKKICRVLKLTENLADRLYFQAGYLPPDVEKKVFRSHRLYQDTVQGVRLDSQI